MSIGAILVYFLGKFQEITQVMKGIIFKILVKTETRNFSRTSFSLVSYTQFPRALCEFYGFANIYFLARVATLDSQL